MQDMPIRQWMPRDRLPLGFALLALRFGQVLDRVRPAGAAASLLADEAAGGAQAARTDGEPATDRDDDRGSCSRCCSCFMLLGVPIAVALGLSSLLTILLFAQRLARVAGAASSSKRSEQLHAARDSVLHPRRRLHDDGRRREAHDRVRERAASATCAADSRWPRCWPACCSRRVGLVAGDGRRRRLDHDRRHGRARATRRVRGRRDLQRRHARHPDPAVDRDGRLRRRDRDLGRRAVHRRRRARARAGPDADGRRSTCARARSTCRASRARDCAHGADDGPRRRSGACC